MKKIVSINIGEMPIAWKRMRGSRVKFKPTDLVAWQELIKRIATEEIDMYEGSVTFPYAGPVCVSILVLYRLKEDIHVLEQDGDNIIKGILDAITKLVIKDDKLKYIRKLSIEARQANVDDTVGTHITVYQYP